MDPSWVIWKDIWSEIMNGYKLGALDEFLLGRFQLDSVWMIWKKFWLEIPDGP